MFFQVFLFEIKYRLQRVDTYLYFAAFLLLSFFSFANGSVPGPPGSWINSPTSITMYFAALGLFMMLVSAALMGMPLYRDLEYNTHEYYLSYPITRSGYFWGRFLGSFLFVLIIASSLIWGSWLGIWIGPQLGWVELTRIGPFHLDNWLQPFFCFLIPNMLFTSAIFFGLVAYTRNIKVIYTGAVIFYLAYMISIFIMRNSDNAKVIFFIDPFGLAPARYLAGSFSKEMVKNSFIPMNGYMLVNRLLWISVALLVIGFTFVRFSFIRFFSGRADKAKSAKAAAKNSIPSKIPRVKTAFTQTYNRETLLALSKIEWLSIVRDNYFRLILAVGIFFLGFIFFIEGGEYRVDDYPLTTTLMDVYAHNFIFFVFLILLFYTGESVHREKLSRFAAINDALPPANWVLYSSKLLALFFLVLLMAFVPVITGLVVQLAKGYTQPNLTAYLSSFFAISLPMFMEIVLFCFALHVIVNNKFAAHGIAVFIWALMFLGNATGRINYKLLLYSFTPSYSISVMNGISPSASPLFWFNLHWLILGSLLLAVAALFYYRGLQASFKERISLAKHRFHGSAKILTVILIIAFVTSTSFIYYNVSVLHTYLQPKDHDERAVAFEKTLEQYEDDPLPGVVKLKVMQEIFPSERKLETHAWATLVNHSGRPIVRLLMDGDQLSSYHILLNGQEMPYTQPLLYNRAFFSRLIPGKDSSMYRLYHFPKPMMPGDSLQMELICSTQNPGFTNDASGVGLVANGFLSSGGLPQPGYDEDEELDNLEKRALYGLGPKRPEWSVPDDQKGKSRLLFSEMPELMSLETVIGTEADQTAIAPGRLDSSWIKNGRKYFHYVQLYPKTYSLFAILSARYEIKKEIFKTKDGREIGLEIYYNKSQNQNVNSLLRSLQDGMEYGTENFGPYPYDQMRLIEGPNYFRMGTLPGETILGESYAWNAHYRHDDFNYGYFFSCFQLGHQWWKYQVAPDHTMGANALADGLSKYFACMVYLKNFGPYSLQTFLDEETWWYSFRHRFNFREEKPLLFATQDYVSDTKAGLIFYGLSNLIGEDSLNAILRDYYKDFVFRNKPPFASAGDLYGYIQKRTPDSLRYYLEDSWEKITLYDNRIIDLSTSAAQEKGSYHVHIKLATEKWYADSTGAETKVEKMRDYITLAIFGSPEKDKDGKSQKKALYLQKMAFSSGEHVFDILVHGKPQSVAIDPFGYLLDKERWNNQKAIPQ